MAILDEIPKTYDDAVKTLVGWHAEGQDDLDAIYLFPDSSGQVVRLVEVCRSFAETGDVAPVSFGASAEFPFKSSVALVTPAQWKDIQSGALSPPQGWEWGKQKQVWPE